MPPTVARLDERHVGGEAQPVRLAAWRFSSSSTTPGSTRAHALVGVRPRARGSGTSTCRAPAPAPIAWPACDVPPPRGVIGTPWRPAMVDGRLDVVARARQHHAERLDLVDAGVGGVERARDAGRSAPRRRASARSSCSSASAIGRCYWLLPRAAIGHTSSTRVAAQRVDLVVEVHGGVAVRRLQRHAVADLQAPRAPAAGRAGRARRRPTRRSGPAGRSAPA